MTKHKFKNIITKHYLYERYIINKESTIDITNSLGCNKKTVLIYMNLFNIKRRTISEALTGKKHSEERNIKMSKIRKKNPVRYWLGKKHSKEHRKKVSDSRKNIVVTWGDKISKGKFKKTGGITSLHKLIRECKRSDEWRIKVFKRDNYTCQECFKRGGDLEAHHKKHFSVILSKFIKEYDQFSPLEEKYILIRLALKYEPFWDITNGQTLCKYCHKLLHRKNKE